MADSIVQIIREAIRTGLDITDINIEFEHQGELTNYYKANIIDPSDTQIGWVSYTPDYMTATISGAKKAQGFATITLGIYVGTKRKKGIIHDLKYKVSTLLAGQEPPVEPIPAERIAEILRALLPIDKVSIGRPDHAQL